MVSWLRCPDEPLMIPTFSPRSSRNAWIVVCVSRRAGEDHHPPALGILLRQMIDERAEPLELGAGLHAAHDAAHRGSKLRRHGAVSRHVGELRHQGMRTAGKRLKDADLREPVQLLNRLGDDFGSARARAPSA